MCWGGVNAVASIGAFPGPIVSKAYYIDVNSFDSRFPPNTYPERIIEDAARHWNWAGGSRRVLDYVGQADRSTAFCDDVAIDNVGDTNCCPSAGDGGKNPLSKAPGGLAPPTIGSTPAIGMQMGIGSTGRELMSGP